ncbi:UNVERIFIED_CONTAM: hypothetical protein FKN15_063300 [Acipenser sinensis]
MPAARTDLPPWVLLRIWKWRRHPSTPKIVEAHASSKDGFTSMGAVAGLEMETASFNSKTEKVTGNLKHLASQVTPGDITSVYGIRKVMGIAVPACLHYCWSRAW